MENSPDCIFCYRLDKLSKVFCGRVGDAVQIDKALVLKMYQNMVTLQAMDSLFFEAQRQGRFSFYLTSFGEEAITIASAAALSDDDMVYAQVNCD